MKLFYNERIRGEIKMKEYQTKLEDFKCNKEILERYIKFMEEGLKMKFSESQRLLYTVGFGQGYTEGAANISNKFYRN